MAAGHRSPPNNNRTIDKNLDEAQSTGSLDLSNRKLNEFPKSAESYDLTDTAEADISKNRFTEVPTEICQYVHLEKLNCYHNAIRSLPESLTRLIYLSFLDLSRNQLSHVPAFLCKLTSLEVLILSNNRIVSIPEEISDLSALMELDVSSNEITAIPKQLGDLSELKILNMRKNLLIELPEELSRLKLKSLDFSCNKIQEIPIEYRHMDSLEELVLDSNPLITPPAHTCTKGRVHILKYLHILAIREDKRRGVLSDTGFNRNTLRRSYQKDDMESVRLRRRAVISTDSGYITDNPNRWGNSSTPGASSSLENGLDGALKAAESLKEQRAERHLELQKRICSVELQSPGRATGTAGSSPGNISAGNCSLNTLESPDGTGGSISPLKVSAGNDAGEDMFARELNRQKQEYEQRKKRAEQVKVEGGARRSGKPPTPQTPPTSSTSHLQSPGAGVTPRTSHSGRPPQPPVRSASVHADSKSMLYSEQRTPRPAQLPVSSIVRHHSLPRGTSTHGISMHGFNYGGVNGNNSNMYQNSSSPNHPASFYQSRHNNKIREMGPVDPSPVNSGSKVLDGNSTPDRSTTDSHRSSPVSVSSQDGDNRLSVGSSVASSGTQEVSAISRGNASSKGTATARSDNTTPKRSSAVSSSPDSVDVPNPPSRLSRAAPSSSTPSSQGKTGLRVPKSVKVTGRSKTAPLPSTNHQRSTSNISPTPVCVSGSTKSVASSQAQHKVQAPSSKLASSSSTKLPIKAAIGIGNTGSQSIQSQPFKTTPTASKFGFQTAGSITRPSSSTQSPSTNGSSHAGGISAHPDKHESHRGPLANTTGDDSQHIIKIREIIETRLKVTLPHDVMTELRDGVVLCHLANYVKPRTVSQIHVKSSAVPKLTMAKCKRNVENFIEACRKLGVSQDQICSASNVLEDKRPGPVLKTIQALLDIKTNNKISLSSSTNGQSAAGARSNPARSRSALSGGRSSSTPSSRTGSSQTRRSQNPPLHSVV